MTWTSRIPVYVDSLSEVLPEAIADAGLLYQIDLVGALREGFTTGKFVTGQLADSITLVPAEDEVSIQTDDLVAVYWELGFHHAGKDGQFERVQVWEPVFTRDVDKMIAVIVDRLEDVNV